MKNRVQTGCRSSNGNGCRWPASPTKTVIGATTWTRRSFATRWSEWRFPYHFIDFETAAVALPFHAGMRPYESLAFQFSHHVMDANGEIRHVGQFLCAEPGVFPNYDFARALMRELDGDDGTVFMWSHHENTILNAIAQAADGGRQPAG